MTRRTDYVAALFLLFVCLIAAGCMTGPGTNATTLLDEDYRNMTNTQLVDYERKLSEELANPSRDTQGDLGVGFSFGSWGSSSGYSVRTDQRISGGHDSSNNRALQLRRDNVRSEMRKRGLLP
jgi:hypothetical protein